MSEIRNQWHALFVETGKEDNVKERLLFRFEDKYKVMVPKRKLRERKGGIWIYNTRILFPGYTLLCGEISNKDYYNFKNIPELLRLLRSGMDILGIADDEMRALTKVTCNSEVIGESQAFVVDGAVKIVDGPLVGLEGHIISVDQRKGRAKVYFDFLGQQRIVELAVQVIKTI